MSEYPQSGELVVCKIKSIKNYGAFVDLLEYGKEGFVHISQIASGWVKNIRSHVSEGQIRVAQVTNVDPAKGMVDVSFRKVSDGQERRKMSDYKRAKKAEKLFERVAGKLKEDLKAAHESVAEPLKAEFGDLYTAFETISAKGAESVASVRIPDKWKLELVSIAQESISVPEVSISGKLTLRSFSPDGISEIRAALAKLEAAGLEVSYISAPLYSLSSTAAAYPEAEKKLKDGLDTIEKDFKKSGEISFERAQK